jgi:hypothetical protein
MRRTTFVMTALWSMSGCSDTRDTPLLHDEHAEFARPEPEDVTEESCGAVAESCAPTACCPGLLCIPYDAKTASCRAPEPAPLLRWGIHPRASDALTLAGVEPNRIAQTIGDDSNSGGTHLSDGTFDGAAYSAATDISAYQLDETQLHTLLDRLGRLGFAAWYRKPGEDGWSTDSLTHVHAVFAACEMKALLRVQVQAWLAGTNGLLSNAPYEFYTWPEAAHTSVEQAFAASGGGAHN